VSLAAAKIAQLLIPVDDFERGIGFYSNVLELPLLFSAPPQMAFFDCGGLRLLVGVMPAGQAAQRGSAIYFKVSDIHAVHASLQGQGVQFKAAPHLVNRTATSELWLAEFADPFGNQLALMGEVAGTGDVPGVRHATLSDVAEIARLTQELGYGATVADIGASLPRLLTRSEYLVAVAEGRPGTLAGWVCAERRLILESGEEIEITGLVVDATQRRRGVGKSLLAAVERWAAQQGIGALVVRSNVARTESHVFYPAAGFTRAKTQHVYTRSSPAR
jgi:methylmalonyl-CoA/ethylmalonyl-CoA epimerase